MEEILRKHFKQLDLDIRKKGVGYSRFMDQKVTPDVLAFISDCVVNLLGVRGLSVNFTVDDVWQSVYFIKNSVAVFGKPSPQDKDATSEYNKFIAQPLKTLAFAKVLEENKVGRKNSYRLLNKELLEYISQSERNAWHFLVYYIEKVLADSGFIKEFEVFKDKYKNNSVIENDFNILKSRFQSFMLGFTEIRVKTEINRIFPKVLNPYSAFYQMPGTKSGKMTFERFTYSDLMYNRRNFRDIGKEKSLTRKEALSENSSMEPLRIYHVQKAKEIIRRHHSISEVNDDLASGEATQVHHIFPENRFPEISDYLENLILLTPQQHNTKAHPGNKTSEIDLNYQKECLLSKIASIEKSVARGETLYSRERFINVVNIGYDFDLSTKTSFAEIKELIRDK